MTGLLASAPIKWLLNCEREVRQHVQAFIAGQHEPFIDVAGTPEPTDVVTARLKDQPVPLPCVRLHFRMVRRIDGPYVEVAASDADLDKVARWWDLARQKTVLRAEVARRQVALIQPRMA